MSGEKIFTKYRTRGPDYHWRQDSANPLVANAFVKARYDICVSLLTAELSGLKNRRIADLGCGDGVLSGRLCNGGALVDGVDVAEDAIAAARQRLSNKADVRFSVASCYDSMLATGEYDGVVSSDVIEHVGEPRLLLREARRLLKPGGIAVISTPVRLTRSPRDENHVTEWFAEDFVSLIESEFSDSSFRLTHPVFWGELFNRGRLARTAINCLSIVKNPFSSTGRWRVLEMQYAVCRNNGGSSF